MKLYIPIVILTLATLNSFAMKRNHEKAFWNDKELVELFGLSEDESSDSEKLTTKNSNQYVFGKETFIDSLPEDLRLELAKYNSKLRPEITHYLIEEQKFFHSNSFPRLTYDLTKSGMSEGNVKINPQATQAVFIIDDEDLMQSTIGIWDLQTASLIATFDIDEMVGLIAWNPEGNKFAIDFDEGTGIKIWDAQTRTLKDIQQESGWSAHDISWSPDGTKIAAGASNDTIRIINIETELCQAILTPAIGVITNVAWSPNGEKIAIVGNEYDCVKIFDVTTGECQAVFEYLNTNFIFSIAWNSDGSKIAVASQPESANAIISVWNVCNQTCLQRLNMHNIDSNIYLIWTHDNSKIIATWRDILLSKVYDTDTGACLFSINANEVRLSPDCSKIVALNVQETLTLGPQITVEIWDIQSGRLQAQIPYDGDAFGVFGVVSLAWTYDSKIALMDLNRMIVEIISVQDPELNKAVNNLSIGPAQLLKEIYATQKAGRSIKNVIKKYSNSFKKLPERLQKFFLF